MSKPIGSDDRASSLRARGALALGVTVAIALLAWLWVGGRDPVAATPDAVTARDEPRTAEPGAPSSPGETPDGGTSRPPSEGPPPSAVPASPAPAYAQGTPLPAEVEGEDAPVTPSSARPTPLPMSQQRFIAGREQAVVLADETVARLEREAEEQERAGRAADAARTRARIQRLTALRARRAEELEQARRGELVPDPDLEPAGPRPEHLPEEE